MELKPEKWINIIKNSVFPGANRGSTTKIVYLTSGLLGTYSALLMTAGMVGVYIFGGTCDPTYAAATGALWVAVFGFAMRAQNHKASTDKADAGVEKLD